MHDGKEYPDPGRGPVYTGEMFKVGHDSYLISIGVEGSEAPPFKGDLIESGPFTTMQGIAAWVRDEQARISTLGGKVTFHFNNAAILKAGLEQIIGEHGTTLDLQTGQFSLRSGAPELPAKS